MGIKTPIMNLLDKASDSAGKPGPIAGRAAQTSNAEEAANPQHSATDVWKRTWEGATDGDRDTNQQKMASAPLMGLSTPLMGHLAGTMGRVAGGTAGYVAAAIEGGKSLKGIWKGLQAGGHSSEFGAGAGQQLSDIGTAAKSFAKVFDGSLAGTPLRLLGATAQVLTATEQLISSALTSWIPAPALPAVRVLDLDVGLPHGHLHPPNLIPPAPMVPLPSTGPVLPIPYVSGAATVLINGMPAARCGDMGAAIWCGGYFPMFEIFLGSSTVWIEGARAARVGTDITKHCIFSNPKSIVKGGDNPVGPPIGFTVGSSPNVIIGGVPFPSLTAKALGGMFKLAFKLLGKIAGKIAGTKAFSRAATAVKNTRLGQKAKDMLDKFKQKRIDRARDLDLLGTYIRSRRLVDKMFRKKKFVFHRTADESFKKAIKEEWYKVGSTKVGRQVLEDINKTKHKAIIEPLNGPEVDWADRAKGPYVYAAGPGYDVPGVGSDSVMRMDPNHVGYSKNWPSDRGAAHELGHVRNNARGENAVHQPSPPGPNQNGYPNLEEYNVIRDVDNPYGAEKGLPPRRDWDDSLPDPPLHLSPDDPIMQAHPPGPAPSPGRVHPNVVPRKPKP
jgi:uncharacterized Zn-binding protein involved in type VI secretion